MFKIEEKTIHISRGNKATIELKVPVDDDYYEFQTNDKIALKIYEQKGLNKIYLKKIITDIKQASKTVDINIKASDSEIGDLENKPIAYWYEIVLNDEQTLIGYDDEGPKEFILYPEGYDDSTD